MMRAQFSKDERNFLALEYHKRKDQYGFKAALIRDIQVRFPTARVPGKNTLQQIWEKQMNHGTVLNCNSKTSPGQTCSGRPRTSTTPAMKTALKAVLDRDAVKRDGDATVSPVSSARRNVLGLDKSAWWRLTKELSMYNLVTLVNHMK